MNEEELQRDILFQIDMQLYDKYNKKIAGMNDHLGDIYTYRDIEEVEQAQKDEKIDLLTKAIKELQKEIESRLEEIDSLYKMISTKDERIDHLIELVNKYNDMQYIRKIEEKYISKDKIREFMKDYQEGDMLEITGVCKFLLGEQI